MRFARSPINRVFKDHWFLTSRISPRSNTRFASSGSLGNGQGGPVEETSGRALDVNGDGVVNLQDAGAIVRRLFA